MIAGSGTAVNVVTVLVGSSIGVLAGNRLPDRTRDLVTDALGLVTLLIAGLSAVAVNDPALAAKVGPHGYSPKWVDLVPRTSKWGEKRVSLSIEAVLAQMRSGRSRSKAW